VPSNVIDLLFLDEVTDMRPLLHCLKLVTLFVLVLCLAREDPHAQNGVTCFSISTGLVTSKRVAAPVLSVR
jgi:hypothetical protein